MNQNEIRQLLYEWHSGQASALYAAASSGIVVDQHLFELELAEAVQVAYEAGNQAEVQVLRRAIEWCQRNYAGPLQISEDVVWLTLPWYNPERVTATEIANHPMNK